jgi:hypothetical protein
MKRVSTSNRIVNYNNDTGRSVFKSPARATGCDQSALSLEEKMSRKNLFTRYLLILPLLGLMTLSCEFMGVNLPLGPSGTVLPPSPTATPPCGGNITGLWSGTAFLGNDTLTYSMNLVQTDCQVAGTSQSAGTVTSTVKGYVENGRFHFTESGTGDACYWTGTLIIDLIRNEMFGQVTNCSQKQIDLFRR